MRDGGSPRNRLLKFASEGMEAQREGAREARGLCAHRGLAALCAGPGFPPSPWRGDLELFWGQQEEGTVGLIPTICHLSTLPGAQHVGFSRGREGDGIQSGPAGAQRGPGSSRLTCASSTEGPPPRGLREKAQGQGGRWGGGAKLLPSGSFADLSPATDPLPHGGQKGTGQEGER